MENQEVEGYVSDITKENSFWKLYLVCRRLSYKNDIKISFWISFIFLLIVNFISYYEEPESLVLDISSFSALSISWSITIVGFILTGYAIYATLAQKDMQIAMSKKIGKNGLSYLKESHCVFMKICIDMILIVAITFLISIKSFLMFVEFCSFVEWFLYFKIFIISLLHTLFILQIMLAKTFIYNVYHSVMTAIRWTAENEENK
ncbi:hypothetical protein [Vibrio metschnikovii]|uniref:hypothetical protein n=1 Tax=Vibrio metschnikovii TaxID=28172 RepID=UPI001CCD36F5|nr:hypothetical protein [Vibrio metschnikovii]